MNDPLKTQDDPQHLPTETASAAPARIGPYRIERVLGKGGFGLVYLAHDGTLQRPVAIKVPHAWRADQAENFLAEARIVAKLDHPHIVPVYEVGRGDLFPIYVVSKFIDGTDLAKRMEQAPLSMRDTAGLAAAVAEALHHAHRRGLVHRDVKPGNILLDSDDKPYVADFGLTLKEEDFGKGAAFAGTPSYMSPEQARGEGHRVDGRSDIFSLGVVLYELLVGRRPFRSESYQDLLDEIARVEARPPRQINDAIPSELERICLKALAKRASERYTTAKDMADDLRHFLSTPSATEKPAVHSAASDAAASTPLPKPTPTGVSFVKIVPKGLRSFDAADADFFLELLPGPRDRDGLPDSLRFWKTRIETMDADHTFAVGLIYGPSGCGKSSLVKAGLLPRLAKSVTPIYVEATGEGTESRLLHALHKRFPQLEPASDAFDDVERLVRGEAPVEDDDPDTLNRSITQLRRGRFLPPGQKVLLVLDQFEQWLHANRNEDNAELVQALRQCDGGQVQCVVLVRDDFWLAVSRFMKATEVEILEGKNSALVDLFDPLHARKVLASFGRAYGRLPDDLGQCGKEENAFLDKAVAGLAQDGKVITVRLALFAEMVKGKTWTPATLKEVGGAEGVGVTFLEETFTASTAPPQHRMHQKAAQAVLKALLPEAGSDIKGHMRSRQELLAACGLASRPKDFDELLQILDSEIRLITPTDPEGKDDPGEPGGVSPRSADTQYYQLTHDYLIPSLRDWLTRKQKETRRGRAELLLADRATVWNARPENRQLPSLLQWARIQWLTGRKTSTPPQRKMMARAGRYHGARVLIVTSLLLLATLLGFGMRSRLLEQDRIRDVAETEKNNATHTAGLVKTLLNAKITQVPEIISEIEKYRTWADPLLKEEYVKATAGTPQKLHAGLALLPVDPGQVNHLYARLLDAEPMEVPVIVDALAPHKEALRDKLWAVVATPEKEKNHDACARRPRWRSTTQRARNGPRRERQWAMISWPCQHYICPSGWSRCVQLGPS